jgi:NAD(P)-dependent dehydrogenase (short-subunit alcohol dehydrogenase family)
MIANGQGAIVNVASLAGLVAYPRDVGYVAAKHGVVGLTKALAIEWACHGIRVNCICPGITETPIFTALEKIAPGKYDERRKRVPIGRQAQPIEQARVMAFLASDDASSVTGVIMPLDGGQMALSSGWAPPAVDRPIPVPPFRPNFAGASD